MAQIDYSANLRKYTASVDGAAVDGIVKYLGIALRKPDSATVAATDPGELARLRAQRASAREQEQKTDCDLGPGPRDRLHSRAL